MYPGTQWSEIAESESQEIPFPNSPSPLIVPIRENTKEPANTGPVTDNTIGSSSAKYTKNDIVVADISTKMKMIKRQRKRSVAKNRVSKNTVRHCISREKSSAN